MSSVKFLHGKKKTRGELRLPQLHFVMMDDWQHKIGREALWSWLQFYTWANRQNADREADVIPDSMNKIQKKLGVGKDTFYNKVIRPLWNFGFIDFQEYNLPNGDIALNIIVYEYPQNNPDMSTKPLEKVRDYDTDHQSIKRDRGKQGGRPRGGSVSEPGVGGSEREPGVVLSENQGGSDTEPNNVLNNYNVLKTTNETNISQSVIASESIQLAITKSKKLTDRLTDIEQVYHSIKNENGYSDALFISTLQKAAKARIKVPFAQYLLKAMINNMKEQSAGESTKNNKDLPEWVKNQTESPEREVTASIDPAEQRQALDLLLQLNEIDREQYDERMKALETFENGM